jgi:multidrug efflux pump subunit AcrA (membrane-fusion protein)
MKRGWHTRLALAAVLLLAAASVFPGCRRAQAGLRPAPKAPADARERPFLLTGELAAVRSADLFVPETPLWELQLRFLEEDGLVVKAGDRVAEFDSSSLTSELEQKRIAAIEAETELVRFDADREGATLTREQAVRARTTDLEKALLDAEIPPELRSRRDHEEKQLALRRAGTELEKAREDLAGYRAAADAERAAKLIALGRARAERDKLETAVSALTLRAPKDGVFVVAENPRERKKFLTGDTLWPGLALARIPDPGALRVDALLFDVDDGRIRAGEAAVVVPDSFPDRRLAARVAAVAPVAQPIGRGSLRRAFRVAVDVTGGDLSGLRPGMSVRVETPPSPPRAAAVGTSGAKLPPPDLALARRARAERRELVLSVELKGELAALDGEPIGPVRLPEVWDYRISFLATEGAEVKKGQPVVGFDTTALAQQLEEKRAEAESAGKEIERRRRTLALSRADLELLKAQAEARRAKAALKVDVPSEISGALELKKARLDLELAQAESASVSRRLEAAERAARAELSILEGRRRRAGLRASQLVSAIAKMTVPAPRAGTVLLVPNWNGDKKKVGDRCWFGEKILEVPDLARLGVQGEVDEADAGLVREGAAVSLRLDAHPDTEVRGRVRRMQRTVQRASPSVPLKVARLAVTLEKVDTQRMKPGMRVRGRVETGRAARTLAVPADAVVPTEAGPFVWVPRGDGARAVPVTVGRRDAEWVEVLSGLKDGDEVLRVARTASKGASS